MTVSHTSFGFAGSVDQIQEAKRMALLGPRFRVASFADWLPTISTSVNRTVNIDPGIGVLCGVGDQTTSSDTVAFTPNTTGSNRYDALIARCDWAAKTITFMALPGTSSPPTVNPSGLTADDTKINRIPGLKYDALIAVVRVRPSVTLFTSGDLVDCRVWAGYEGYGLVGSGGWLTMIDSQPGALVLDNTTQFVWNKLPGSGGTWAFEKWAGTDRNLQPMIEGIGSPVIPHNVTTLFTYDSLTDHSSGLLTPTRPSGTLTSTNTQQFRCNAYGKVRVFCHAFSDSGTEGWTRLEYNLPVGGGFVPVNHSDQRYRAAGFSFAGSTRQTLTAGPIQVQPGDIISAQALQYSQAASSITYSVWMAVTYV